MAMLEVGYFLITGIIFC